MSAHLPSINVHGLPQIHYKTIGYEHTKSTDVLYYSLKSAYYLIVILIVKEFKWDANSNASLHYK